MNPSALKDGEHIKLIFAFIGDANHDADKYYDQIIVVSQETGDTCNILVPVNHALKHDDGDKVFNYFSPENPMAKLFMFDTGEPRSLTNIDSTKVEFPKYQKVAYDSKYRALLNNKHPTVLGLIGTEN